MNQISFQAFALRAQQSSPGGVNPKPVGGPSGAGGLPVCISKKPRRKPRPVDQLPLPLQDASSWLGREVQLYGRIHARYSPSFQSPAKLRCEARLRAAASLLIGGGA